MLHFASTVTFCGVTRLALDKLKYFKNDQRVVTNDSQKKRKRKKNMQAKHNVLMGFFFGAQYHSKISGVHGFLRVRSFGMIRIRVNDPTSLRSECIKGTAKSHLEKEDSLDPFMHHDPRDLGNEKGTGTEMLPAIVCGIATGDAPRMSIETVPDVSGSFDSSQFPSRF